MKTISQLTESILVRCLDGQTLDANAEAKVRDYIREHLHAIRRDAILVAPLHTDEFLAKMGVSGKPGRTLLERIDKELRSIKRSEID